jgi:hypothetical protein
VIRLDDTSRVLGVFVSAEGTLTAPAWTATGHERQVFLDQSGRRRRRCGVLGVFVAVFAVMWLTAVVSGPVGFSNLPSVRISSLRPLPGVVVARHTHASHGQTRRRAGHRVDVADAGSVVAAKRQAARPSSLD